MNDISWEHAHTTEKDLEPNEYFKDLKDKLTDIELSQIEANKQFLSNEIQKVRDLGQKSLSHKWAYLWKVLEKEMILNATGYTKFVYRHDVINMIDNIVPKNSVKIIELENFPRIIPDKNSDDIKRAQSLNLFDMFIVVYTDFVQEQTNTPAQKSFVARNKDPIVFGIFLNDKIGFKHDRLYFITDWEDEFCDLTFTRMIEKMSELKIKNPEKTITPDINHINTLISQAQLEIDSIKDVKYHNTYVEPKPNWFKRLINKLFRKNEP